MADRRDVSGRRSSLHEKREHKVLSLYEKLKILDLLNNGMSCAEVGRRVGKNESSIRSIKQKQAEIRQSLRRPYDGKKSIGGSGQSAGEG
ncbi:hypothetical protein M514_25497 [Trichuris suis]|uniref:HTH psq-type domain-containing protein n=1 Tax=Trichuris suis TaxID=68888 RepID=A0A085MYS8_9BILA|nr:hypothetical protein M514_25497 [Trichuris suis]